MARRLGIAALVLLLGPALIVAACGSDADSSPADDGEAPLRVIASTAVIAEWMEQVGGDRVEVTALVPAGTDVHTLQLDPSQVIAITEADLVLLSGGGLEAGFLAVIEENARGRLVELAEDVDLETFATGLAGQEAGSKAAADPHFWLDAERAIVAIERIAAELIAIDPRGAESFEDRTRTYVAEVRRADAEVRAALAGLPPARRILVTFHDAFGYFARRYDLTVLGFVVEGPEEEPSAADLAELVEAMQQAGVGFVFREPQFSARVVEQVARETGAAVRIIYSQPWGDVGSYLEVLRANASAIAE